MLPHVAFGLHVALLAPSLPGPIECASLSLLSAGALRLVASLPPSTPPPLLLPALPALEGSAPLRRSAGDPWAASSNCISIDDPRCFNFLKTDCQRRGQREGVNCMGRPRRMASALVHEMHTASPP